MNIQKKREAFEAKFKYQSDLDKVVFCEAENKYKALPELKSYELVRQIVGRVNDQWELWQAAHFQVPEGYILVPKDRKYFSHDFNGDGFTLHDTLEEAKKAAEADLDLWRDRVADGNHVADMGEYDELTYGVVLGQAAWSVDCVVSEKDHKDDEYTQYEVGTEILSLYLDDTPSTCCIHCNDGDGECAFPYFGLAPHSHSLDQPKPEYPINYCDTDGGQGVYTHCLVCGADKNTLPFGASHE